MQVTLFHIYIESLKCIY